MHKSVLLQETLEFLDIKPDGVYFDGTFGAGGVSKAVLDKLSSSGRLIACDLDPGVSKVANSYLKRYSNFEFHRANFTEIEKIIFKLNIFKLDGIVLDLGISSIQLDDIKRGFSLKSQVLDMRLDQKNQDFTAADIINQYSEEELARIFKILGEQPFSNRLAAEIVKERTTTKINSPKELLECIKRILPQRWSKRRLESYLINILRALRIEVNQELSALNRFLPKAVSSLKAGGRIIIISFHSLEDRIVKTTFKNYARGCICPPSFPKCMCNRKPQLKIITQKPVTSRQKEKIENPRASSAKLRVAEKLVD